MIQPSQGNLIKKLILFISDIIIFILNITTLTYISIIFGEENTYKNSVKLFLVQFILILIIVALDLGLNIKNIISRYIGHIKYGMLVRFVIFHLYIPCVFLTYQKGNNTHHEDIRDHSQKVLIIGLINIVIIIASMVLGFLIIDYEKEEKILVRVKDKENFSMNSLQNMKLLKESYESSIIKEQEMGKKIV